MAELPNLTAFLALQRTMHWSWAEQRDCTMLAADWVLAATGKDPAAKYRGRYASADEAHALIIAEGGYMPMIGYEMDRLGLDRTQSPSDGDVAIVKAPVSMSGEGLPVVGTIGGIAQGGRFWVRGLRGLHHCVLPMVTAWKVA